MAGFEELDPIVTLAEQLETNEGPVVLVNVFTVDPAETDALVEAGAHDAAFLKEQPG